MLSLSGEKFRIYGGMQRAANEVEEHEWIRRTPHLSEAPVVLDDSVEQPAAPGAPAGPASGGIKVKRFSDNRLELDVDLHGSAPAWLYYANAWHPRWKARVNGEDRPVRRANGAFLAVRVDPGANDVAFYYHDPVIAASKYFLAVYAVLALMAGFGAAGLYFMPTRKETPTA